MNLHSCPLFSFYLSFFLTYFISLLFFLPLSPSSSFFIKHSPPPFFLIYRLSNGIIMTQFICHAPFFLSTFSFFALVLSIRIVYLPLLFWFLSQSPPSPFTPSLPLSLLPLSHSLSLHSPPPFSLPWSPHPHNHAWKPSLSTLSLFPAATPHLFHSHPLPDLTSLSLSSHHFTIVTPTFQFTALCAGIINILPLISKAIPPSLVGLVVSSLVAITFKLPVSLIFSIVWSTERALSLLIISLFFSSPLLLSSLIFNDFSNHIFSFFLCFFPSIYFLLFVFFYSSPYHIVPKPIVLYYFLVD